MVATSGAVPRYYKHHPAWAKTIYITGLPRSGKSTLYNILGSCLNVEALEEPFELLSVAQKGSSFPADSELYAHFLDSYMAIMENLFSELVLGRIYNFRGKDKSCIYNFKTVEHVQQAHSLLRRSDVLQHTAKSDYTFLVAFNDIEKSIKLITQQAPAPMIVHVKKDYREVGWEIAGKGWLSDEQLSTQANLTPAYGVRRQWQGQDLYVPYLFNDENIELFLSLDTLNRSLLYAFLQDQALEHALGQYQGKIVRIQFEELANEPERVARALMQSLGLQEVTGKTVLSIDVIKQYQRAPMDISSLNIHDSLIQYISNYRQS